MNKAELIEAVAKKAQITKKEATNAVNATFQTIKKETKKSEGISIVGFGSFVAVKRKGRKGRNPRTGEAIMIKPSKGVRFRPGKSFKEHVQ